MKYAVALAGLLVFVASTEADEPAPFGGKVGIWEGFTRHDFMVDGANAVVVEPKNPLPGRPWAWRGEFFGAFPNADVALLKQGWHLAYVSIPNQFGSPRAMALWEKFHDELTRKHGLSKKPALIGLSRGALYCMAWAALHPEKTLLVYLDNGVCDFKSWPGGKLKGTGSGPGSAAEWANLLRAFGFKDDAEALAYRKNPVDHLGPLADAKIPILLVYGDSDKVVPHLENSELVYRRYLELKAPCERIVKAGGDHHPHGLVDPAPIVAFFEKVRTTSGGSRLSFHPVEGRLAIRVDGAVVATYVWSDPDVRRPYFADLKAPGGLRVSRNHPPVKGVDADDHATMHPGLWLAFGDLAGSDFWRNKGLVRQVEFVSPPASNGDEGGFTTRNRYEVDGSARCEEIRRVRIRAVPDGWWIDWTSTFSGAAPFAFGDQEEMGLGVRMHTPLTVKNGGRLINSEGRVDEKGVWGRQADWCSYSGKIDGEPVGVTILPSPTNFRRSWFHARDYGLLVANPFGRNAFTKGEKSRVEVKPGETLTLRFAVAVRRGEADPGATAGRLARFLAE